MALGGIFLRVTQTTLRAIQLLASILVLAVYSYFLAVLSRNDVPIAQRYKAVEGISGAAVLYGGFAVFLTLCLGGMTFFAFIALVLDLCFSGCFIAIAYYNRDGRHSCRGFVNTPLGSGEASTNNEGFPSLHRACQLEKAVFAVAIVNVGLFLITAVLQVALVRHHKREKRYGPSPANNYTSGFGRRSFWRRNKRNTRDAELATAGVHDKHGIRPSHDTGYTGNTEIPQSGYGHGQHPTTATNY